MTYLYSDYKLSSSYIETLISGTPFTVEDVALSDYKIQSTNIEALIKGSDWPASEAYAISDYKIQSSDVEVLIEGETIYEQPRLTNLRQIYSDGTYVYTATNKGLAVFNP